MWWWQWIANANQQWIDLNAFSLFRTLHTPVAASFGLSPSESTNSHMSPCDGALFPYGGDDWVHSYVCKVYHQMKSGLWSGFLLSSGSPQGKEVCLSGPSSVWWMAPRFERLLWTGLIVTQLLVIYGAESIVAHLQLSRLMDLMCRCWSVPVVCEDDKVVLEAVLADPWRFILRTKIDQCSWGSCCFVFLAEGVRIVDNDTVWQITLHTFICTTWQDR